MDLLRVTAMACLLPADLFYPATIAVAAAARNTLMTAVSDRPNSAFSPSELPDTTPPGLAPDDLAALVRRVAGDVDRWLPKLQLPDGNDRWWTRLAADDRVDLWLLSWLPGHNTDLHDHGDSAAAFRDPHRPRGRAHLARPRDGFGGVSRGRRDPRCHRAGTEPSCRHPRLTHHRSLPMNYFDPATLRVVRTVQSNEPEEELPR